jgi:hypothetical protein
MLAPADEPNLYGSNPERIIKSAEIFKRLISELDMKIKDNTEAQSEKSEEVKRITEADLSKELTQDNSRRSEEYVKNISALSIQSRVRGNIGRRKFSDRLLEERERTGVSSSSVLCNSSTFIKRASFATAALSGAAVLYSRSR